VNILKNALERAGFRIELARGDAASIGKVLGHPHPGAVPEPLRAAVRGDGDDGALGRVLAEGVQDGTAR
jgi:hypothetical protein